MNNIEELLEIINTRKLKKVFLQLPDGLKRKAIEIADELNKKNIEVIISADPCYGACDLRIKEAEMAGCDLIVHVGHNKFLDASTQIPVVYFPWNIDVDINEKEIEKIAEKRIGLVTTIQHLDSLEKIAEKLRKAGKEPVIGGQILGCRTENAEKILDKTDAILFIGSGSFHALGLKRKAYRLDVEKGMIVDMAQEIMHEEKKRQARMATFMDAGTIGIIVSSKPGQFDMQTAHRLKKKLEEKDKKAFIIIMDEVTNDALMPFKADAYINTACPRLTDSAFSKTIVNAGDLIGTMI
ncbi:MAG: diphthamide biosynthesis enzyme Dph2 [Candidatus Aenigmarchaeota archaeon]|nr:diphthamide biosynthesis enzyme Dph2 [Candidatus Aenigmarchaeota archaeon]